MFSTLSPTTFPRESKICAAVWSCPFLNAFSYNLILILCNLETIFSLSFCQSSSFQVFTAFQSFHAVLTQTPSLDAWSKTNCLVVSPSNCLLYNLCCLASITWVGDFPGFFFRGTTPSPWFTGTSDPPKLPKTASVTDEKATNKIIITRKLKNSR